MCDDNKYPTVDKKLYNGISMILLKKTQNRRKYGDIEAILMEFSSLPKILSGIRPNCLLIIALGLMMKMAKINSNGEIQNAERREGREKKGQKQ